MVQTILYERACNPDTRVKPDKTRNLEYYSGILCKTDYASGKNPPRMFTETFIVQSNFF